MASLEKIKQTRKEGIRTIEEELNKLNYEPGFSLISDNPNEKFMGKPPVYVEFLDHIALIYTTGGIVDKAEKFCGMRIIIPKKMPIPKGSSLLFHRYDCGDNTGLGRDFPYAETHEGYKGVFDTYLLPIDDVKKAVEIVKREVEFTRRLLKLD